MRKASLLPNEMVGLNDMVRSGWSLHDAGVGKEGDEEVVLELDLLMLIDLGRGLDCWLLRDLCEYRHHEMTFRKKI